MSEQILPQDLPYGVTVRGPESSDVTHVLTVPGQTGPAKRLRAALLTTERARLVTGSTTQVRINPRGVDEALGYLTGELGAQFAAAHRAAEARAAKRAATRDDEAAAQAKAAAAEQVRRERLERERLESERMKRSHEAAIARAQFMERRQYLRGVESCSGHYRELGGRLRDAAPSVKYDPHRESWHVDQDEVDAAQQVVSDLAREIREREAEQQRAQFGARYGDTAYSCWLTSPGEVGSVRRRRDGVWVELLSVGRRQHVSDEDTSAYGLEPGQDYTVYQCVVRPTDEPAEARAQRERRTREQAASQVIQDVDRRAGREGTPPARRYETVAELAEEAGADILTLPGYDFYALRGGGTEYLVAAAGIWVCSGRGADGDDWSTHEAGRSVARWVSLTAEEVAQVREAVAIVSERDSLYRAQQQRIIMASYADDAAREG